MILICENEAWEMDIDQNDRIDRYFEENIDFICAITNHEWGILKKEILVIFYQTSGDKYEAKNY